MKYKLHEDYRIDVEYLYAKAQCLHCGIVLKRATQKIAINAVNLHLSKKCESSPINKMDKVFQ